MYSTMHCARVSGNMYFFRGTPSPKTNRLVKTCRYHCLYLVLTCKIARWMNHLNHGGNKKTASKETRVLFGVKKRLDIMLVYNIFLYLYDTIFLILPYYILPYYPKLFFTILYYTILCCNLLYFTILYYTLLHYTIPYFTILY